MYLPTEKGHYNFPSRYFFLIHLFIVDENTVPNINLQLK